MILVVGATGLVGSGICQKLAQRGEQVRALVRSTSLTERVEALRAAGVELCLGDLKDSKSLAAACEGAEVVISTASSTLSRQPGDSIESVDAVGQLNLVEAAKDAKVSRFVFVSFRRHPGLECPLSQAKEQVERAITSFNFTVIQASFFMEIWLSPALGFDYPNRKARLYGTGTSPISWVSSQDVAEFCALVPRHPMAERRVIEFGGPKALSPLDVVARFESASGREFQIEHVPESALRSQFEGATEPLQKSFAALMLGYARGDAIEMRFIVETFGVKLTTVEEYASSVTDSRARAC
jgi:uncharacterized protein YbjT (DUF2867 family)